MEVFPLPDAPMRRTWDPLKKKKPEKKKRKEKGVSEMMIDGEVAFRCALSSSSFDEGDQVGRKQRCRFGRRCGRPSASPRAQAVPQCRARP